MKNLIVLVGCGKMGSAMLRGWLAEDMLDKEFVVIEPESGHLGWIKDHAKVSLHGSAGEAAEAGYMATMIVLAVKPQLMEGALVGLDAIADKQTAWLSIAAGITTDWFKKRIGKQKIILRSMPNTPAAIGRGITVLYAGKASDAATALATRLLGAMGSVVPLHDEALMDAVTALSGSGPAYVFLLTEVMSEAGIKLGLPADLSNKLAEATVAGAGALVEQSDEPPSQLRVNVTSRGGTTAAALEVLLGEDGLDAVMTRAITAARDRSIELGD